MADGPGKYHEACNVAREACGVGLDGAPGGVILIVMNGKLGHGFECQGDAATLLCLPDILENLAKDLRRAAFVGKETADDEAQ